MSTWQGWPEQPGRPELRIGDADRERAASQLAEHYAVGRITQDEHAERLDRIWAARTHSELAPVFSDLPGPGGPAGGPGPAPRRTPPRAPGRSGGRGPRIPLPLLVVLVVLAVVAAAANLPLVLVGLGVWFFFFRGGGCGARSGMQHGMRSGAPHRW